MRYTPTEAKVAQVVALAAVVKAAPEGSARRADSMDKAAWTAAMALMAPQAAVD